MEIFFLLLFFMVFCKGCNREFKNDHGLKRHRPVCVPSKIQTASLLRKRHDLTKNKGNVGRPESVAGPSLDTLMETGAVSIVYSVKLQYQC